MSGKRPFKKIFRSIVGASLLQVLFGSSAIAGLALIGIELSKEQKELADKILVEYETKYLLDDISYLLENPKTCWSNFSKYILGDVENSNLDYLLNEPTQVALGENDLIVLYKTLDAGGVLHGQSNIYIDNYELGQKSSAYEDFREGIFYFNINFIHKTKTGNREIPRKILISYKVDQINNSGVCSSLVETNNNISWDSTSQGSLILKNANLSIGSKESKAKLFVDGGVLLKTLEERECRDLDKGTFRYLFSRKAFEFCDGERWHLFGDNSVVASKSVRYNFESSKLLNEEFNTAPHRICFLSQVKRKGRNDSCLLSRANSQERISPYKLELLLKKKNNQISCDVTCID